MTVTVKELIEFLREMPPDAQVVLQKDAEGNGYSPLSGFDGECVYTPETSWRGEIFDTRWSPEDAAMDIEFPAGPPPGMTLGDVWSGAAFTMAKVVVGQGG